MPRRRSFLGVLWAAGVGTLVGCSALPDGSPPVGSVKVINDNDLPHTLSLEVVDVGWEVEEDRVYMTGDIPEEQRRLSLSAALDPDEERLYEDVFTGWAYYKLGFSLDGQPPEEQTVIFRPLGPGHDEGGILELRVESNGRFTTTELGSANFGEFAKRTEPRRSDY